MKWCDAEGNVEERGFLTLAEFDGVAGANVISVQE